ncbi:MAG: thioesterase family protein [Neisseria sp.]|nr:thioesterase family protein [Neisseria sp.]
MTPHLYTASFTVDNDDLDETGHMNNVRYLYRLQEAAIAHWKLLSDATVRENYLWVARRHELDYLASAFLGESLTIRTFVGECRGALSTRHYEITRDNDGQRIVQAQTRWCLLQRDGMKVVRIPAAIAALFESQEHE